MAITVPNTFVDGETIDAARQNANFSEFATKSLDKTGDTMSGALITSSTITANGAVTANAAVTVNAGVAFPATQAASADANTLDDYEEGTWTPTIGGATSQSGQVYSVQVGKYVKVGKLVTAYFYVQLSTLGTITGAVQVKGLPFTTENTTNLNIPAHIGYWTNMTTSFVGLSGLASPNTTAITIYGLTAAATGVATLAQADLANTTIFGGTITYAATN